MTPEEMFKEHFGDEMNGITPVLVEYGWVREPDIAYELSCDQKALYYGFTVLQLMEDNTIKEVRHMRRIGADEEVIRQHLEFQKEKSA